MSSSVGPYLQIGENLEIKQNFLDEYQHHVTRNFKMKNSSKKVIAKLCVPFLLLITYSKIV